MEEADDSMPSPDTSDKAAPDHRLDFPVVGIGASAGGLQAFQTFLKHLPDDPGMAFVLVQHLDPDHESELPKILQRATGMPVTHVEEGGGMELVPNRIYVIPPNRNMTIEEGDLHLSEMTGPRASRAPIDHFFRSLADSQDGNAVGMVFSGTGSGGTTGLKRIKERGGITLVQDPEEAKFEGMPRSAVRMGLVDVVAPTRELAERLVKYRDALSEIQLPSEVEELPDDEEEVLDSIFEQLRTHTGNDFSQYKRSTMLRRIGRRMQVNQIQELSDYRDYLREHRDERQALSKDLLITVTNFFRDEEAFETLREDVIPQLFEEKDADDTVRVWAAGCATGEEAYSLAILLHEYADTRASAPAPEVQLFATDLGEDAIRTAREGFYPQNIAADLSDEHLKRYFEEERDGYRVRRDVRESVIFAEHNLMNDPPFSQLDLVVCRNLLIYLKREAQSQVFNVFHYALRPGGYLFLGTAESAEGAQDRFQAVNKDHRIYRRSDNAAQPPHFEEMPFLQRGRERTTRTEVETAPPPQPSFEDVRLQILEEYAPPGVVVNEQNDVVHVFKGANRYLRVAQGAPTHDVLEIIRPELRSALRSALFQARNKQQESRSRPVTLNTDGRRTVRLVTRSMEDSGFVHVRFEENDGGGSSSSTDGTPSTAGTMASAGSSTSAERSPAADLPAEERDEMIEQLEAELKETRHELQGTVEEYETSMEELRASNEELQSMNEELRSTTEELETSKEELRSMNEELTTVNQELNNKNEELSRVNSDLQNLLRSTEIATLFLDRELRIQRFTPHAEELFNIIEADRGRPLEHVSRKFQYDGFIDEAEHVLDRLTPVEEEVQNDAGRWFLVQIRPYRTAEDKIDGVVITFVDITERKEAEAELRRSEERYRLLLEGVEEYAILMLDLEGRVATWNTGAEQIFGYTEDEIVGRPGAIIFTEEQRTEDIPTQEIETARKEGQAADERWHVRKDGTRFWGMGVTTALHDENGDLRGFAKVVRDNTERREAEEELRRSEERYRLLLEGVEEYAILMLDAEGHVATWNAGAEQIFGYAWDDIIGRLGRVLYTADDRKAGLFEKRLERARAEGRSVHDHWLTRCDGSRFWGTGVITALYDEDGDLRGFVKVVRDNTERKQAEEKIRALNETLEERVAERTAEVRRLAAQITMAEEHERQRIAGILHDDLQQLLYGAEMSVRQLRRELPDEGTLLTPELLDEKSEILDQIEEILNESVERTRSLSKELAPPELHENDLSGTLRWLGDYMEKHFNLSVKVDLDGSFPTVKSRNVHTLLFRLLRELLFNVVKHAETNEAVLQARLGEGNELHLEVRDEGVGFDPATLKSGESGYGLSEMRERLELLDGRMELTAAPGEGVCIQVAIPHERIFS